MIFQRHVCSSQSVVWPAPFALSVDDSDSQRTHFLLHFQEGPIPVHRIDHVIIRHYSTEHDVRFGFIKINQDYATGIPVTFNDV